MNTWFADTFFFIAFLAENDAAHDQAVDIVRNLKNKVLTTEWVLTELADAMASTSQRTAFQPFVQFLQSNSMVQIVPATTKQFGNGIDLYRSRADKQWSLTDCISFIVMQEHGLTEALTGDRHFEQAGFKVLFK